MRQFGIDVRHRPQPTPAVARSAHRRWLVPFCMGLILVVYLAQAWYYHNYVNDDAYITFRYSRSLADGLGPFYNPSEHVEGYTSPSMMLLMAAAIRLFGASAAPVVAKMIGVLSGALCVLLAFLFTRFLGHGLGLSSSSALWGLGAAALVAANPGFALNSTSGLETTLFALLLLMAAGLATLELSRRAWYGSGVVFALAILTRPEGVLLFGLFWATQVGVQLAVHLRPRPFDTPFTSIAARRLLILNGLIVTSVLAVHLALRYITYDGEWLPNTYYAKLSGFLYEQAGTYIAEGILPAVLGPLGLLAALIGLAVYRQHLRRLLPLAVMAAAGCLLPLWTGKGWMPGYRLVMPYIPLVACLVALGWASLVGRLARRRLWVRSLTLIVAIAGLFYIQNGQRAELHRYVNIRSAGYSTGHAALADWLNHQTPTDGGAVALMDIGLVGYYCPGRNIIDITGLTDRFIAKSEGGFLAKDYDPGYILAQSPEFIVLTLTAPGPPDDEPPSPTSVTFWTPIERRLYYCVEFQKSYLNHTQPSPGDDDNATVARRVGAERIFEHAYPDARYLLAVFRHRPAVGTEEHAKSAYSPKEQT